MVAIAAAPHCHCSCTRRSRHPSSYFRGALFDTFVVPASFGRLDFSSGFELYSEILSFTQTNLFSVDIANRRVCDSTPREFAG
jgi:hypothetical protein